MSDDLPRRRGIHSAQHQLFLALRRWEFFRTWEGMRDDTWRSLYTKWATGLITHDALELDEELRIQTEHMVRHEGAAHGHMFRAMELAYNMGCARREHDQSTRAMYGDTEPDDDMDEDNDR